MIELVSEGRIPNTHNKRYVIDAQSDLTQLESEFVNEAYCIANRTTYICNGAGEYVEKQGTGGGGGGSSLPDVTDADNGKVLGVVEGEWAASGTVAWDTTVTIGFSVGTDTATIDGTTFVKTSDRYFTDEQLVGASFHMFEGSITITADMLVDMTPYGVDATGINLPDYGMVVFCAHSANEIIPSVGTYLVQRMSVYAPLVTLVYVEHCTAQMRPIAYGTAELEDGVSDLPTGVLYFQIGG